MTMEAFKQLSLRKGERPNYGSIIWHGDALKCTASHVKNSTAAVWVFDPPFFKMEEHRARGTKTRLKTSKASSNEWFPDAGFPVERYVDLIDEACRTLVKGGHFFMKCDFELLKFFLILLDKQKGKMQLVPQRILPWNKQAISMGYIFRPKHEVWLWCTLGADRRMVSCVDKSMPDTFHYKRLKESPHTHTDEIIKAMQASRLLHEGEVGENEPVIIGPAQTPVAMIADIICQTSEKHELIIDPFSGWSGAVSVAAALVGRASIAAEIHEPFQANGKRRLDFAQFKWRRLGWFLQTIRAQHLHGGVPPGLPLLETPPYELGGKLDEDHWCL